MQETEEALKAMVQTAIENAHMSMSEEEFSACLKEMAFVVEWAKALDRLPLEGVKMTVNVNAPQSCPMRPDVVTPPMGIENALAQAPAKLGSCFVVPQVISE